MGIIPETMRTWPGAIRSAHPQSSFAAIGPNASYVTANHAIDCRFVEQSSLAILEEVDAQVLLLGAGFDVCTTFHLAEYRTCSRLESDSFAVMTEDGREWTTVQDLALSDEEFEALGADFEQETEVMKGLVGAAEVKLFGLGSAVSYATSWFRAHRGLHGRI